MKTVPLIGYTDKISTRPGEKIEFKISSKSESDFTARLFRSINADPNPSLGGLKEIDCDHIFEPIIKKSREQKFFPGSFAKSAKLLKFRPEKSIKLSCKFFPTLLFKNTQCLISIGESSLEIDKSGCVLFDCCGHQGDN